MKSLVLCVCVFILAFQLSDSSELRKQVTDTITNTYESSIRECMTENNATEGDWYTMEEMSTNVYANPENAERTRRLGCWIACIMKKLNILMADANIKEATLEEKIEMMFFADPDNKGTLHRIRRKCLKEVRDITQECEKCFSLLKCYLKEVHDLQHINHQKHI
ncbi:PREDICTED: pheromone-binding protein Gp-9-like [Cyphomyrmex costatus]|uniref:Pheromone-binding protein Gp-9 n=1 Tax=Cyphomyrmex costatus TaxID=456900 RepID=A0A151ICX6_9HYME|nr:PREDICTED: pheromone-binding protein Gp-9-like [Cyphomyrmex costatus]KYM98242.1 Pheromone-binding protein Gp-9 [Cyphomyrmex costatus]